MCGTFPSMGESERRGQRGAGAQSEFEQESQEDLVDHKDVDADDVGCGEGKRIKGTTGLCDKLGMGLAGEEGKSWRSRGCFDFGGWLGWLAGITMARNAVPGKEQQCSGEGSEFSSVPLEREVRA